jgi:hypothetical protein
MTYLLIGEKIRLKNSKDMTYINETNCSDIFEKRSNDCNMQNGIYWDMISEALNED